MDLVGKSVQEAKNIVKNVYPNYTTRVYYDDDFYNEFFMRETVRLLVDEEDLVVKFLVG